MSFGFNLVTLWIAALLSLGFLPWTAAAETVVRMVDNIKVTGEESVDGDLYAFSNSLSLSGEVAGDLFAVSGFSTPVILKGSIAQDLFLLSLTGAQIHSPVSDDVRVFSGTVTISDHVGGDLFVVAEQLQIMDTAVVEGNVYFFKLFPAGKVNIDGEIKGSVFGEFNDLVVSGLVGGNLEVNANTLEFTNTAKITGEVTYSSLQPLLRSPEAVIEGEIINVTKPVHEQQTDWRGFVSGFLMLLFGSLVLYVLGGQRLLGLLDSLRVNSARHGLVGVLTLLLSLPIAMLLMVTLIGAPLGLLLLLGFVTMLTTSFLLAGPLAGGMMWLLWRRSQPISFFSTVAGTAAFMLVFLVPIVGPLLGLVFLVMLVGLVAEKVFRFVLNR